MTTGYVINIGNASAKQWVSLAYEHTLNAMSNCQVGLDGVTSGYSTEFDVNSEIYIYKNGTLKFRGITISKQDMTAGGIVLTASGIELELAESKCPMVGSKLIRTFNSTTDNSIIDTLVTSVTGWTTNVTNSSATTLNSFRVTASESVWNGVINLIEHTGKDIRIDQENKVVYLYDELTANDKFSYIEGKNAIGIMRTKLRSKAGKVIVYGKGDGEFQIVGSSGASTPVHTIIDRNITSVTAANARALVEYNKLNPNPKRYNFSPTGSVDNLGIGDMGNIANNSAGIDEEVDLVRIKMIVDGKGIETIGLEVTNPAYRLASKNAAEGNAQNQAGYNQSQSSMQGSGNTQSWARGINAKLDSPLTIPFYVSPDFVTDEAGNMSVESLTLDYDVDPYRRGVGTASETNKEPSLAAVSKAALHGHTPYETGSGHDHTNPATTSNVSLSFQGDGADYEEQSLTINLAIDTWVEVGDLVFYSGYESHHVHLDFANDNAATALWYVRVEIGSGVYYPNSTGIRVRAEANQTASLDFVVPVQAFTGTPLANFNIEVKCDSSNSDVNLYHWWIESHKHNISSYNSNDKVASLDDVNDDPSVSGKTDLHKHDVAVGDDVSDAGSVNASQVSIHLDYWNGSSWDLDKHTILNTGKTLDTDVDITDSGTYPDATGFWRVRINPNHASPDLVQGIIKMKFAMDN